MTTIHTRRARRAAATIVGAGALLAGLAPGALAAGPVLYGATGTDANDTAPASNLYTINPFDGSATSVGSIGSAVTGLAVDPTSGKLYGVTAGVQLDGVPRSLLTIDPATGAGTTVGSIGVNEIEDIAFNSSGQLYGWNETGDDLVKIDKASGAVTVVGDSGLGVTFGSGIAFDRNNALVGLLNGDAGNVWSIDPNSGAATKGARLMLSPNQTGATLGAAAYGCDGSTLYSVVNDFGDPTAYLVTIDTAHGDINTVGPTKTALDALAWGSCEPAAVKDTTPPKLSLLSPSKQKLSVLRKTGLSFKIRVDEMAKLDIKLLGRLTARKGRPARGKSRLIAKTTASTTGANQTITVTLKPNAAMRKLLAKEKRLPALFQVKATDLAGNSTTRTKALTFK